MAVERVDVVVVGLGAMGAATLFQLAKAGSQVVGIDQYAPPHMQGSSHGDTRITRLAIGEGAAYIPLVRRSHQIWRELEAQQKTELFEQCGVLIMSSGAGAPALHGISDFTAHTIELARENNIDHDVLSASQIRARFPQFGSVPDDTIGYFEPEGGYLRPERCIAAQLDGARALGASLLANSTVRSIQSEGATVRVKTDTREFVADKVVVCAGMWSAALLGDPFTGLLKVCRQNLYWYQLESPSIFPQPSPSFIYTHGPLDTDVSYGFPPIPGEDSIKIGTEQYAALGSIDALDRNISQAESDAMFRHHVANRMNGVTPHLVKASVCTYTVTPDQNFIIDAHPLQPNVVVVSACSGHGFKHSAAIGEAVAQRCLYGRSDIDLSAFALSRFG